jgi:N-methylhydantoinase A
MAYLGVDIGGTFTDLVLVSEDGELTATKVPSTPPQFERGFLAGIDKIAGLRGVSARDVLTSCDVVLHGTTVATNAVVQMRGAKVGVLTTRGHRDALPVMRSSGRAKGLSSEAVLHSSSHTLPEPIVDPRLILEVDERIDAQGQVVVPLQEDQVVDAVKTLVQAGVEAIAICFLWSVANPNHELRVRELIHGVAPDVFINCSHEASSRMGEYERFTAASLNAFLGPETTGYLNRLAKGLSEGGLDGRLLIMQASGGVAAEERASTLPTLTIGSGPSAGVAASLGLAKRRGEADVIATDMGGTSFDVALIAGGTPVGARTTIVNQYEFFLPRTDIRSIGSGGGSIIWFDEASGTLKVGPASAGARPGPVCYGQGGTRPTLTDANLVLGYLNAENFLGGAIVLDPDAATAALEREGAPLGMSAVDVAIAARRIVEATMAGLIRQMTVERGMDPRDFALYAYGGAGGLHVAGYLRELGCDRAVIPLGELSTTWSAYGCATSDLLQVYERPMRLRSPLDPDALKVAFAGMEAQARDQLDEDGIPEERQSIRRSVEMKYPLQIHQVEVDFEESDLEPSMIERLVARFTARYEQLYGRGSSWEGAGVELVGCRLVARGRLLTPQGRAGASDSSAHMAVTERPMVWANGAGHEQLVAPVISAASLMPETPVEGPAVIEADTTTVVIPGECSAAVTGAGDLIINQAWDRAELLGVSASV